MELPEKLHQLVGGVNKLLATQRTLPSKLEAVSELLERTVPNCDAVSVALIVEGTAVTAGISSLLAIEADLVQYGYNEGPCLTAVRQASTVRIDVHGHDERFEHFAPGAIELGVESILSIPLVHGATVVGSINMYSNRPHGFDGDTEVCVRPVAEYATQVIVRSPLYAASLELIDGIVAHVAEKAAISTAIGFLMASRDLSKEQALSHLRALALETGSTLAEIADQTTAEDQTASRDGPRHRP